MCLLGLYCAAFRCHSNAFTAEGDILWSISLNLEKVSDMGTRLPKKNLTWVPKESRPVGRLGKRWIDGLKAGMSRRSITLEEIEHVRLYDDRNERRAFRKSSS